MLAPIRSTPPTHSTTQPPDNYAPTSRPLPGGCSGRCRDARGQLIHKVRRISLKTRGGARALAVSASPPDEGATASADPSSTNRARSSEALHLSLRGSMTGLMTHKSARAAHPDPDPGLASLPLRQPAARWRDAQSRQQRRTPVWSGLASSCPLGSASGFLGLSFWVEIRTGVDDVGRHDRPAQIRGAGAQGPDPWSDGNREVGKGMDQWCSSSVAAVGSGTDR